MRRPMPSLDHELLVELFRAAPRLAPELLRRSLGCDVPEGEATLGSIDLSQVASASYAADAVIEIRAGRRVKASIIVEVQRQVDPAKRRSWPVYVTALRARLDCPVMLLVLAASEAVARWARLPILIGHPGFCLEPLVITASEAPAVDLAAARGLPELAMLSALGRPGDEAAAVAAAESLAVVGEDRARLYFDVLWSAVSDPVRAALEAWMQRRDYQSDFARKYVAEGREVGREEGREEGLEALRTAAGQLLVAKLGSMPQGLSERLAAIGDVALLEQIVVDLGMAQDAEAARAIAERIGGVQA